MYLARGTESIKKIRSNRTGYELLQFHCLNSRVSLFQLSIEPSKPKSEATSHNWGTARFSSFMRALHKQTAFASRSRATLLQRQRGANCQASQRAAFLLQPSVSLSDVSSSVGWLHVHQPPSTRDTLGLGSPRLLFILVSDWGDLSTSQRASQTPPRFPFPSSRCIKYIWKSGLESACAAILTPLLFASFLSSPERMQSLHRSWHLSSYVLVPRQDPPLSFSSRCNLNKKNKLPHYLGIYIIFFSIFFSLIFIHLHTIGHLLFLRSNALSYFLFQCLSSVIY